MAAIKAPISTRLMSMGSAPSASCNRPVFVRASRLKTSFFAPQAGALKFPGVHLSRSRRSRCNGHGGGSFHVQNNLFDRFARVIKSYANAIISSFEDPEKILEQSVLEMNDDLTKMRQATAQVLASQKQLENKYRTAQQASEDWYKRAQLALGKGEEDLAREALKRRKAYATGSGWLEDVEDDLLIEIVPFKPGWDSSGRKIIPGQRDNANGLKAQLDQQKAIVDNLVSNTRLLESKIQEARSKKDTLKARAQSAKTATKVSEMLGNVNTSSALSAFEKMEEKVLAMESQADALNQLTSDDLEGKFALLEGSSVDDDLADLKKELSGSKKLSYCAVLVEDFSRVSPESLFGGFLMKLTCQGSLAGVQSCSGHFEFDICTILWKGDLPPGRTAARSTSSAFPFQDTEIERELNELRRKAQGF
ncbi:hypothetical protein RHMOL_Rhmol05G0224200 [Rhododendron molle]|uniref:Uncharacterized protein n=1 Tax=Rhododendron molle TaxID=49168 RepID=A0ACC0NS48_RHOML|nr:hypothetical protein RHMOL_Rhmol05G0224200 [Rhododendron molle]